MAGSEGPYLTRLPDSDDDEPAPEAEISLAPPLSTSVHVPDSWGAPEEALADPQPMQRPSISGGPAQSGFGPFDDSPFRSVEEGSSAYDSTLRPSNIDDDIDDDLSANGSGDGLIASALRSEPDERAVTSAVASRQALMSLVLWRNPVLTGGVFLVLNLFSLLVIFGRFTVIGLCANAVLLAIFAHVLYRLASLAYLRFTNKRLDAYAAIKQHVGSGAMAFTSVRARARSGARRRRAGGAGRFGARSPAAGRTSPATLRARSRA